MVTAGAVFPKETDDAETGTDAIGGRVCLEGAGTEPPLIPNIANPFDCGNGGVPAGCDGAGTVSFFAGIPNTGNFALADCDASIF